MLLNWGVGKDAWESLGLQEIKPVNPKGNQSWIFIGRTKAEAPIVWSPDVKSWLIGKDPDAGKDWSQEEKGTTEDEMASPIWRTGVWATSGSWWWTGNPGVRSPWGCKVLQTNEQLNWTEPLGYQGIPKIWCFHLRIIHVFAYFFGIAFPTFSIWVCMALSSSYIMKSQMAQSSFLNSPIILILQTHFFHCFLYYLREDRCHHICTNF